ncbi:MAG: type 2 isopentenyl-diphosphate Delta-isomerase [Thermoplasmata archaeon]|nr:MAG: type 2 isopentenyl-diphosphate Delta-isomerase [Thermoplasmata archaeon]
MNQIERRKEEHVEIALREDVRADHNFWDDVRLYHNALPEMDIDDVDTSMTLLGKELDLPLIISGMTGGYRGGKKINETLAKVAESYRIGMGVGSQRSALENRKLEDTYSVIKDFDIPLKIANIGASQIARWSRKELLENVERMIGMIDADALAICLNLLQEVIQPEGEAHAKGCIKSMEIISDEFDVPIIAKETGAGISGEVAKRLIKVGISAIDIGGYGGTNFAAIEYHRAKRMKNWLYERLGKTFWEWGIPAPISLMEVSDAVRGKVEIIASGGIRNGLDIARSIALGADCAGMAYILLKKAVEGLDPAMREMEAIKHELRTAMFLTGSKEIEDLKRVEVEVWI